MTNKERYKQAFSVLPEMEDMRLEKEHMQKKRTHYRIRTVAAVAAVCAVMAASLTVAYAADVGGIRRMVQIWMHGELTNVTLQMEGEGGYALRSTDAQGNVKEMRVGGRFLAPDGSAISVSREDILDYLTAPEVVYEEDGSVVVYWHDNAVDVSEQFTDGVCYVHLENGTEQLYLTIRYRDGYSYSPDKYVIP